MPSGGRLSGRGRCSRHAPQAHCQDDPRERERNSSHKERKALIAGQCERGQPRDDAERCHDDGCRGPFKVQVDVIRHDGFPRRCRSGSSRPRLVVIAPVIHGIVPFTSRPRPPGGVGNSTAIACSKLRGSDGRQPSARSALQRLPHCRLRAVSDRAVSSPDHTQRRNMLCKGSGSVAMPKDGRLLRQAFWGTRIAPYAARPRESRAFPCCLRLPLARHAEIAAIRYGKRANTHKCA